MRLQFQLNKIKIDPSCHIQIARHAEEYQNKSVTGLLYGALYDDEADITSILPFPDSESMLSREDLLPMERRHEEKLSQFNLDHENIGLYFVSTQGNLWQELENVKLYEEYINTSFFLVYDYEAKLEGRNPYQAFRLSDKFAMAESFSWKQLESIDLQANSPFVPIPAVVQKNQLFQAMMLFNKKAFLEGFATKRNNLKKKNLLTARIENYLDAIDKHEEATKKLKEAERRVRKAEGKSIDRVNASEVYEYIASDLKLQAQEQEFKKLRENMEVLKRVLQ